MLKEMPILDHNELKYLLIDSLKTYSEDIIYISGNNPYKFSFNKKDLYITIKNIHDSGRGRGNDDESRIQIQKTNNYLAAKNSGKPVLFLGYFADLNVFTAWNPFIQTERINLRRTVSLYTRFSVLQKAVTQGIAVYSDNDAQKVISFKPEYLGLYLENYANMHQADEVSLLELIKKSDNTAETEEVGKAYNIEKQAYVITHKVFKRDQMFKRIVGEVYNSRCAFCGIQLELVEAAHIIPHAHPQGTDDPSNGICLCALHHTAYDRGLIYFDEEYKIKINIEKSNYLTKIGKDGGMQKFLNLQFELFTLPNSRVHYPTKETIMLANNLRGINGE